MFTVSQILGGVGRGVYVLMSGLDIERGAGAAAPLGYAFTCIMALGYNNLHVFLAPLFHMQFCVHQLQKQQSLLLFHT